MSRHGSTTVRRRLGVFSALALCGALTACGGSSSGTGAAGASSLAHLKSIALGRSSATRATARAATASGGDFVTAVGVDRTALPIEVQFALRKRPEVGEPVELDIRVTPTGPLGRLIMSFHAEDGLAIAGGEAASETDRPAPGIPLSHALTIVAQRDGIYYVKATVLVDVGADSIARTFTIPVIAGAGAS